MTDMSKHARLSAIRSSLTGRNALAALIVAGCCALAAPTFIVLFLTVTHLLNGAFDGWAWTVPVSTEAGYVVVYLADIYLEMRERPARWLRYVTLPFIAASLWLNVYAADGHLAAMVGHAVVTLTFFGTLAIAKMCARRLIRARAPHADRIPRARWILSPWRTLGMRRRMILHDIVSYPVAVAREEARLAAISLMPAVWGDDWKRSAPPLLRHHLTAGTLPSSLASACSMASPGYIPATGELAEEWVTTAKATVARARAKARQDQRVIEAATATADATATATRKRQPAATGWRDKAARIVAGDSDISAADLARRCGVSKRSAERFLLADSPDGAGRPSLRVAGTS